MNNVHRTLIGLSACFLATVAIAADKPFEKEIKARQGLMTVVGFNMGNLGAMAKGKVPYDAAKAEAFAKNIYAASMMDNSAMWPAGSDNSNPELKGFTDALPYGWENYEDVSKKHSEWVDASKVLADNAGKSLADLRQAMGGVGKTCKGCHKKTKAR